MIYTEKHTCQFHYIGLMEKQSLIYKPIINKTEKVGTFMHCFHCIYCLRIEWMDIDGG